MSTQNIAKNNEQIKAAELILSPENRIYHLDITPEQIADKIILTGDPDRAHIMSGFLDSIEFKHTNREFVVYTGELAKQRLSIVATGIGTDNIDIVLNEIDALVNIDFTTRRPKANIRELTIVRVGTSGSIQVDIPIDSILVSTYAIDLTRQMEYYNTPINPLEMELKTAIEKYAESNGFHKNIGIYAGDPTLIDFFIRQDCFYGIAITCSGFYGPQGRTLRAECRFPNFIKLWEKFNHQNQRITNLEMETAGIYGLGRALGHHCCSVNAIIANRPLGQFTKNLKDMEEKVIRLGLECISQA